MNSAAAQETGESHARLSPLDVEPIDEGDERWYSNDYYLVAPYTTDLQFIRQWHHDDSNGSPPIALCTTGGKLNWDYITTQGGNDQFYDLGAYPTNKWFHVTIHLKLSSGSDGLSEVWVDGVKKMSLKGPNKFKGLKNLEMIGIYHWQWKATSYGRDQSTTIYIDNAKEWKPQ